MKAQLVYDLPASRRTQVATRVKNGRLVVPEGTILEGRQLRPWWYVQMGCAIPLDDECIRAAGMTLAQIDHQLVHYKAKVAGIQPEDMAAFLAGAMTGYDDNGDWIPGPKYADWAAKHSSLILDSDEDE